jgi:hypothetical protein
MEIAASLALEHVQATLSLSHIHMKNAKTIWNHKK